MCQNKYTGVYDFRSKRLKQEMAAAKAKDRERPVDGKSALDSFCDAYDSQGKPIDPLEGRKVEVVHLYIDHPLQEPPKKERDKKQRKKKEEEWRRA